MYLIALLLCFNFAKASNDTTNNMILLDSTNFAQVDTAKTNKKGKEPKLWWVITRSMIVLTVLYIVVVPE